MIRLKSKQIAVEPIYDSDFYNPSSQLIKIPETSKERCDQGIVKYMGTDCDPSIEIGSHVIFSGYTGTTIAIDDEILILMHNEFVKARITNENYDIPGLYLKSRYEGIFPATHDVVVKLLRDAAVEYSSKFIDIKREGFVTQRDPIDERNR